MSPRGPVVIIDTNVWISGLLTKTGAPAQLTRQVVKRSQPVFSADTFAELKERLWRPKFDRYIDMDRRKQFLHDIDAVAYWINVPQEIAQQSTVTAIELDQLSARMLKALYGDFE